MPVKTGTCDHALSITYLLKSMSVAGSHSGICLLHLCWSMPHVGILGGIALCPVLLHGIQPDHGARSWWSTSLQTDCVNGILIMTHCAPFRAYCIVDRGWTWTLTWIRIGLNFFLTAKFQRFVLHNGMERTIPRSWKNYKRSQSLPRKNATNLKIN